MYIESLILNNFRSYPDTQIKFHEKLTFFYGKNAVGKTNILEAISILSLGKSFRNILEKDIVHHNSKNFYILGNYKKGNEEHQLGYGFEFSENKIQRKIKLNGKVLQGRKSLIGEIITVIFSPNDITICDGSSLNRRRFIDTILCFQDAEYLKSLIHFNHALKQRNALLKKNKMSNIKNDLNIEIWNLTLVRYGSFITKSRLSFFNTFKEIFKMTLGQISEEKDKLELKYLLSCNNEEENYNKLLEESYKKDLNVGYTSIGPHRHDFYFQNKEKNIMNELSQGQKRSLVLALRIAQYNYLKNSLGLNPILLIDDVIGELDDGRRDAFVKLLTDCGQVIVTSPNLTEIEKKIFFQNNQSYVYNIIEVGSQPIRVKNIF